MSTPRTCTELLPRKKGEKDESYFLRSDVASNEARLEALQSVTEVDLKKKHPEYISKHRKDLILAYKKGIIPEQKKKLKAISKT